jgi:hypothetical protein
MMLYTCILPVVEALQPAVSISFSNVSSTGCERYFLMVLRLSKESAISDQVYLKFPVKKLNSAKSSSRVDEDFIS